MNALARIVTLKGAGMKPWKQAMFVDHELAACVVWGGARRSARMATKDWRDRDVLEFVDVKRGDRTRDGGFLWSANNSVLVDDEFWTQARKPQHTHARRVFEAVVNAAYMDATGEPGFINADKLVSNLEGVDTITGETCIDPSAYRDLHPRTMDMIGNVLAHVRKLRYQFITNPCGEVTLSLWGGLCLIGDICLARVDKLDDAIDAARLMSRFLVRCNLMRSEYAAEVRRTNRIGVSLTGIHEFAWRMFDLTFADMVSYYDECAWDGKDDDSWPRRQNHPAHVFWWFISAMRDAALDSAEEFSRLVGLPAPHTTTTIKPSGTVSKVMGPCTEGAHLPAWGYYLRWVMQLKTDPEVEVLRQHGYPIKDVSDRYAGHVVAGFPTRLPIAEMMGDRLTTADQVSIEDNYKWLRLLERFWIGAPDGGNQVSYTLKYDAAKVSYAEFADVILEWQPKVRCCAVMPQDDWRASERQYGYVPEQPITREEYLALMEKITPVDRENYDDDALACASGICPIEPDVNR